MSINRLFNSQIKCKTTQIIDQIMLLKIQHGTLNNQSLPLIVFT